MLCPPAHTRKPPPPASPPPAANPGLGIASGSFSRERTDRHAGDTIIIPSTDHIETSVLLAVSAVAVVGLAVVGAVAVVVARVDLSV